MLQAQINAGVKSVNGITTLPSWLLDLQRQYIHKQMKKYLYRFASTQKKKKTKKKYPHTITQMNGNINVDSNIADSMNVSKVKTALVTTSIKLQSGLF
jgi:hypothetical protein